MTNSDTRKTSHAHSANVALIHSAAPVPQRNKLLALPQVCAIVNAQKSTIYALLKDPESGFPKPVKFSRRMVRWSENAVLSYVARKVEESEALAGEVTA